MNAPWVFLNGRIVPESEAVVSVFDRGFTLGDGLFESIRVLNGRCFRWAEYLHRLSTGANFLHLKLPFTTDALRDYATELVWKNQMPDCLLRINLSRGVGPRGYSPKGADHPTLVMSLHPAPPALLPAPPEWRLMTSSVRLPANEPLAHYKTANKLPQILARIEADNAGADDALVLNAHGHIVESTSGNLFWIENGVVCTSPLGAGVLPGVTRAVVFEVCQALGVKTRECEVSPAALARMEGVFLSLTSFIISVAVSLDGKPLARSPLPTRIRESCVSLLLKETSA